MKRLLALLLFAVPLMAQSPVTVTGIITDAGNNPAISGTVRFDLIPTASSIHYFVPGVGTITQTTTCGINASGQVKNLALSGACTVWGNDVINPANTQYKVTFFPNGTFSNAVSGECITGVNYSLSNPVFCPVLPINPQNAIVRSNPFQTNIIPSAANVFNIGTALLPYASGYFQQLFQNGVGVPTLAANNNWTGVNSFNANVNFLTLTSESVSPALVGNVRLAGTDIINWRNAANSADVGFSKDAGDDAMNWTGSAFVAPSFVSSSLNHANGGQLRLASGDAINWRNNVNSADVALSKNASDNILFAGIRLVDETSLETLTNKTCGSGNTNFTCVVYSTASASTNAAIGATTMVTAGGSGNTYRFTFYLDQTVLGNTCTTNTTIQVILTFTDPNNGSGNGYNLGSFVIVNNGFVGTNNNVPNIVAEWTSNTGFSPPTIRAKASTVVSYSTVYTGGTCTTTPSYQVYPILEQLN